MKIKWALLLFFCLWNIMSVKSIDSLRIDIPIHITILDESVVFPGIDFLKFGYNPAGIFGTEFILKEKPKRDWHITANLGLYYHKDWQTGVMIFSEMGHRWNLKKWSLSPRLGLGYAHLFSPKPVYKFKDTAFQKVKDFGSPAFMGSLSANFNYRLTKKIKGPEIFLTLMSSIELPINIWTSLHHFAGLGFKFYPFN